MKEFRLDYKKIVSVVFIAAIVVLGVLSFALNPVKILGGLARGYIDAPEEANVLQRVGNGFSTFDGRMSEYFVLHDRAINNYGLTQRLLGKSLIDDADESLEVLKLKNGYLTFRNTGDTDYSKLSSYLKDLNDVCEKNSVEMLYVNKVSKNTDDKKLLPDNYPYVYSSNYDELESELSANGIEVLNIESVIDENNIDKYSLFFKTDHHWTPKTGVWVSQLICERLNQTYNFSLDTEIFSIDNYSIETYEDSFLGSQGKRVGAFYAGVDDFDVIIPKYETDMELTVPSENKSVRGSFESTIIHRESITPDNLLNKDCTAYETYMQGNHALVNIKNNELKDGKKALLILDSYGCVVAPYLSQSFSNLDCIDLRSFTDSLEEYVEKTGPDVVIYMTTNYQ